MLGRGVAFLIVATVLLASVPAAGQGDAWFYQGGEPGVVVTVDGTPVGEAASPASAIAVDPSDPLRLSISIAPPPGETWEVRAISVGLLLRGPGTTPPDSLVRRIDAMATLPPGFTVVLNRSIDLGPIAKLGAGTFLMEAQVLDVNDTQLYVATFYVRVPTSAASMLTVQGATITAMTAATGYGLWQIAVDLKELRDAWARHRKKRELAKLDVIGKTEEVLENTVAKGGRPLAGAVSLHRQIQEKERGLGPVRWAATGLGLGGLTMAWLQFLGYLALDVTGMVVTAVEVCAAFLTVALLANALLRRRKPVPQAAPEPELVVRVPVQEGSAQAIPDVSEAVQPTDKRG